MTLRHEQFARRFEQHILPGRFVKYSMTANWHNMEKQADSRHPPAAKFTQTDSKNNYMLQLTYAPVSLNSE